MQPRFLFHIGAHKTGTTYLQLVFRTLAPAFAEHGVHVPEQWYRGRRMGGHHRLPVQLQHNNAEGLRTDMAEVMRTDLPDVLISAEGLCLLNRDQIQMLRDSLGGAEARFVFHCRRWSDLLPSHWQTLIRGGRHIPWPHYYRDVINAPDTSALNFASQLNLYAQVFGGENISIVSYSNVMDARGNLAIHFLDTFLPQASEAFDPDHPAFKVRNNVSLPVWQTEILRVIHATLERHGHDARAGGVLTWLTRKQDELDLTDLEQALMAHQRSVTIDDSMPRLRTLHGALFRKWGGRLVNPGQPNEFFEPRTREVPFIHPRAMRDRDAAWLMYEVFERYRRENGLPPKHAEREPEAGKRARRMVASEATRGPGLGQ